MISTTLAARPASQKQFDFIKSLLAERDASDFSIIVENCRTRAVAGLLTSEEASTLIGLLQTLPRKAAAEAPAAEPEAGIYQADGRVYRVYLGQQAGRMLVKEVLMSGGVTYQYLGSAARCLPAGAIRLSVEEVGSLGKAWDHCLCCGRRLDDPESVDRGIGPVCAKTY